MWVACHGKPLLHTTRSGAGSASGNLVSGLTELTVWEGRQRNINNPGVKEQTEQVGVLLLDHIRKYLATSFQNRAVPLWLTPPNVIQATCCSQGKVGHVGLSGLMY